MIGKTNALSGGFGGDFEVVNITLKTNQDVHTDLIGATITLKYGSIVVETFTWNGNTITYKVHDKVEYTLECSNVEGYKSPIAVRYNSVADNVRQIDFTYQTEIVSVTLNADNGVSVDGQKVTIDETVYTYQGSAIIQKVPFGKAYTISVDSKAGFISPLSKSFTANQSKRDVVMTYKENKMGVFILDTDGKITTSDNWDSANNPKAVGVAVLTNNCKFVIAPTDMGDKAAWGSGDELLTGVGVINSEDTAKQDFKGETNTDNIITQLKGYVGEYCTGAPAAEYCRNYTFKNGMKGYLGALGEWQAACDNKAMVDACMSKIGGKAIYAGDYWTSTQESIKFALTFNWNRSNFGKTYKTRENYVRAFAAL